MNLSFRSLSEDSVGDTWRQVFAHGWPGWRAWYRQRVDPTATPVDKCRQMMRRFLPGMERTWDRWVDAVDGDEEVARFLSFWSPPRYLVNCSQLAGVDAKGPFLIRNYDLDPRLNEATILKTRWHGLGVIGMAEGMAGLSDGMNTSGLALSLTFGGRIERGRGFGIPLIMRYVLETCRDAQDALAAFREIPSHMSYNITAIDRQGHVENMMVSPDRPVIRRRDVWATNHQLAVEWPRHGRLSNTVKRGEYLEALTQAGDLDGDYIAQKFIERPIHSRSYIEGFGTVFTAMYRPTLGAMSLMWGDGAPYEWRFDDFPKRILRAHYHSGGSSAEIVDSAPSNHDEIQRLQAMNARNQLVELDGWTNLNPSPGTSNNAGENV